MCSLWAHETILQLENENAMNVYYIEWIINIYRIQHSKWMGGYFVINSNFIDEYVFHGALINIDKQLAQWNKERAQIGGSQWAIAEREVPIFATHPSPFLSKPGERVRAHPPLPSIRQKALS